MDKNLENTIIRANASVWDKSRVNKITKKGLYEVWYIIVDDLKQKEAYWIRFTLMCPQTKIDITPSMDLNKQIDGIKDSGGMLWFGYFNSEDLTKNFMVKKWYPLSKVKGSFTDREKFNVTMINDAILTLEGSQGDFTTTSGKKVAWDLKFSHFQEPYISVPRIAYTLKITNTMVIGTNPNFRVSGTIMINEQKREIREVPGIQYHTYGDGYKVPWEWLSVHTFKEIPNGFCDLGYKINKGSVGFSDGTLNYFIWNHSPIKKFKMRRKIKREYSLTHLKFNAEFKNVLLEGEISVPQNALLGVEYKGPQGNSFYCYNSEIANAILRLSIKNPDNSMKYTKEFHADESVAFETVWKKPQPGISYLKWEKEEL